MLLFTTLGFFIFFAIGLLVYYLVPKKIQWIVLLVASSLFYISFSWKFLFFIIFTITTIWGGARLIQYFNNKQQEKLQAEGLSLDDKKAIKTFFKKKKKTILVLTILLNIGILVFLKYANFFIFSFQSIMSWFGVSQDSLILNLILPLGISFYIFQSIGYLVDVYWGKVKAEKNIFKVGLFISFFPQIVQGPISRYGELAHQFDERHEFKYQNLINGFILILWGLFKKLVIADILASSVNIGFDKYADLNGWQSILTILFYLIQDYADFSGCIDIARGVAECFGIKLPINFARPYFSLSIPEYWRRWHITLGTWFKDYIFYPISISKFSLKLGKFGKKFFGNFGKQLPAIFGLIIVWLATGLWHGASWTYVVWGIYYGLLIILSVVCKPMNTKIVEKLKIKTTSIWFKSFQWLRTIWLLCVGRIIFRSSSLIAAWEMFKQTFSIFNFQWVFDFSIIVPNLSALIIALIATGVLLIVDIIKERKPDISLREQIQKKSIVLQTVVILALIFVILIFGSYGPGFTSQDFVYMQF